MPRMITPYSPSNAKVSNALFDSSLEGMKKTKYTDQDVS